MITSITFQFKYNKNYVAKKSDQKIYGEKTIEDLKHQLAHDAMLLRTLFDLVEYLQSNLSIEDVPAAVKQFTGKDCTSVVKTKTKRSYYIHGLTIHEDDLA